MAMPDLGAKVTKETMNLSDGTTIAMAKLPGISDTEWAEYKAHFEASPEEARRHEAYWKDAAAIRSHLQQQTLHEYYAAKLGYGDEQMNGRMDALEYNPEFRHIFEDIKRGGAEAAMLHYHNEPLMMKISRAMGGVPEDVRTQLEKVQKTPLTIHEACKLGHTQLVRDYINANGPEGLNEKDAKGVTCLGYAIGANRTSVVQVLIENGADPFVVDSSGGTGLHYAAAYGRKELLDYLISAGGDVNAKNTAGQTPLALAQKNKQSVSINLLKAKDGRV